MNEIEKLYNNAGIKNYRLHSFVGFVPNGYKAVCYEDNPNKVKEVVREFTAEKQLELIKWLAINNNIDYCKYYHQEIKNVWVFVCVTLTELASEAPKVYGDYKEDFEQAFAGLINNLWQDLTEEERKQIKEILE